MSKKKAQSDRLQFFSPEKYLKERARPLPIGKCYIKGEDKSNEIQR